MDRYTLKETIGNAIWQYKLLKLGAERNGSEVLAATYTEALTALEGIYDELGLNKTYEDEGRYVYGVRIFLGEERLPMAELAFGDGGRPNGETKIIRWTHPDERDRYVINSYTFVWDERTKDIAHGESFEEYKNFGN